LLHQTDWCAEVAKIPEGGAKDAPPGFFDKHRVRLKTPPEESARSTTTEPGAPGGTTDGPKKP
jgi:hypothetical protein